MRATDLAAARLPAGLAFGAGFDALAAFVALALRPESALALSEPPFLEDPDLPLDACAGRSGK